METDKLTLGSLFDGSGGFPLGALLTKRIVPLWASEIEPFPIRVTTKRLPRMKHYGDISAQNGADLPPVDIIAFGSPCQDMSVAGKRSGLDGERSSLFYQAVRIVKEMRCKTHGEKPRYIVWENVRGAFSSNKGKDFRAVLDSLCKIKREDYVVPELPNGKWDNAGCIMGENFSLAWRLFDAQYWGVPQRRKRIYLVADFDGGSAGKILFESEGVSGYTPQGFRSWQGTAGGAEESVGTSSCGDNENNLTESVADAAGFCTEPSANARSIGYAEGLAPTLRSGVIPAAVVLKETARSNEFTEQSAIMFDNHPQDVRYNKLSVSPTIAARYGTGGNNQPLVLEPSEELKCYGICSKNSNSMKSDNPHSGFYEAETSRCLDANGGNPSCNQGGMVVVAVQGSMIGRTEKNGPQGSGIGEDVSFTLNTVDRHAVAFSQETYDKYVQNDKSSSLHASEGMHGGSSETLVYSTSKNFYHTKAEKELADTLVATDYKDPPIVYDVKTASGKEIFGTLSAGMGDYHIMEPEYIIRRLTPTECERLQGFPDWWCSDLGTEEPTEEELAFWKDVFETHRKIMGTSTKPKTENQIRKWLKDPHSDSAEYKMWGNGVALPCVYFVLSGIVWASEK